MKYIAVFCIFLGILAGCKHDPPPRTSPQSKPVEQSSPAAQTDPVKSPDPERVSQPAVFDPSTISKEQRDTAKLEIQQFIQQLNGIIRAKNYNAWVSYLDQSYFATINSPEYLNQVSKSAVLVKQGITLKNARDYFNHVVVPSRDKDRVDDIEFVSPSRVKAYTINSSGNRLRLYDLEQTGSGWKIIN